MTNSTGDSRDPCGSPDRKGTGVSRCPSNSKLIIRCESKLAMVFVRLSYMLKCLRMVVSLSWRTQLKAPSMLFPGIAGLRPGLFFVLSLSHFRAGVTEIMRASIKDRCEREPNWFLDMARVTYPSWVMCLARIFSNVLLRHERREIGWRFLGSEVSVRPGLGIGMHLAAFHARGKTP